MREGGFKTKMLLTVHDEIVFDMLKREQDEVMPVIEAAMRTALPMQVPIVVDMGYWRELARSVNPADMSRAL